MKHPSKTDIKSWIYRKTSGETYEQLKNARDFETATRTREILANAAWVYSDAHDIFLAIENEKRKIQ